MRNLGPINRDKDISTKGYVDTEIQKHREDRNGHPLAAKGNGNHGIMSSTDFEKLETVEWNATETYVDSTFDKNAGALHAPSNKIVTERFEKVEQNALRKFLTSPINLNDYYIHTDSSLAVISDNSKLIKKYIRLTNKPGIVENAPFESYSYINFILDVQVISNNIGGGTIAQSACLQTLCFCTVTDIKPRQFERIGFIDITDIDTVIWRSWQETTISEENLIEVIGLATKDKHGIMSKDDKKYFDLLRSNNPGTALKFDKETMKFSHEDYSSEEKTIEVETQLVTSSVYPGEYIKFPHFQINKQGHVIGSSTGHDQIWFQKYELGEDLEYDETSSNPKILHQAYGGNEKDIGPSDDTRSLLYPGDSITIPYFKINKSGHIIGSSNASKTYFLHSYAIDDTALKLDESATPYKLYHKKMNEYIVSDEDTLIAKTTVNTINGGNTGSNIYPGNKISFPTLYYNKEGHIFIYRPEDFYLQKYNLGEGLSYVEDDKLDSTITHSDLLSNDSNTFGTESGTVVQLEVGKSFTLPYIVANKSGHIINRSGSTSHIINFPTITGLTEGSYGNSVPDNNLQAEDKFNIPYITVDKTGRITSIENVQMTMSTKIKQSLNNSLDAEYPLLFSGITNNNKTDDIIAEVSRDPASIYYNPGTKKITVPNIYSDKITGLQVFSSNFTVTGVLSGEAAIEFRPSELKDTNRSIELGVQLTNESNIYELRYRENPFSSETYRIIHGGNAYSDDNPKANGTASSGTASTLSRSDHVHPLQTTITGNAATATTADKVKNSLTIKGNGTELAVYNGSATKTVNITPSSIGAAASSHGTHVSFSSTAPKANGTASVGTATTVSRSDHVHPLQTSVSGSS